VDGRQRLVRIAQQPQAPGQTSEGKYLNIQCRIDSGTAPLGVTERQACLQVCAGDGQLPKFQQGHSQIPVRSHEAHRVLDALGQGEGFLRQLSRRLVFPPYLIERIEIPPHREELCAL